MGVGGLVESSCFHSPLGFMETAGALSPKTKDPLSHLTFAPQGIVAYKEQSTLGGHKATTGRQQDVTDSYCFS